MAEERVERRLTAILAADVAGYSRLMGADEEGTLAALKVLWREVVDPKIKEHRGRIVNTTGDGLLSEFASVVDAVRCAVEVQREMAARNAGVPTERRIDFRIGVNLGDIIIDENDIFGDGVNVAARLEALARMRGALAAAQCSSDDIDLHQCARDLDSDRRRRLIDRAGPAVRPAAAASAGGRQQIAARPFARRLGDTRIHGGSRGHGPGRAAADVEPHPGPGPA
jgi:class 3 adenylate cyclase